MALVALPSTPSPAAISWELVDFGGTQQGPLGGAAQRVNRLGNRWRYTVTMPPMTMTDARIWTAALTRGLRNGVSYQVLQPDTPTGTTGTPLVNGAGQTGAAIVVDSARAGYSVAAGQWLSILTGGRRYLYMAAAYVKLAGGAGTIQIDPPLRATPADNDPVELAAPVIEGLLSAAPGWGVDVDQVARGIAFTIEEVR